MAWNLLICFYVLLQSKIITISGFKVISGEAALKRAIAQQPVAACIDANVDFQNYKNVRLYFAFDDYVLHFLNLKNKHIHIHRFSILLVACYY